MSDALDRDQAAILEGPPGVPGLKLLSAQIDEELGRPYTIDLRVLATSERPKPAALLGQPMAVHLDTGQGVRHFHGLVSEVHFDEPRAGHKALRIGLRPWIWFLRHAQDCRVFQNLSAPLILAEVFGSRGFEGFENTTRADSHPQREFVVQYRESDLDFVHRLMEDAGLYYFFRHESDKHVLILCDDLAEHHFTQGCASLEYRPDKRWGIESWELSARLEPRRYLIKDYDFERPQLPLLAPGPSAVDCALGELEHYDFPGGFSTPEQGASRARLGGEVFSAGRERYTGTSNARVITCGALLEVTGHKEYAGKYLVVSSTTHITAHDVESGPVRGDKVVTCSFVAQPASVPFRLARVTPKPLMGGAQTAVVTGRGDEDGDGVDDDDGNIETDRFGRVRIKFHWDRARYGKSNASAPTRGTHSSCWVRVSQLWAGAGFGALHLPRVGQEVIVDFLDGDPDRPIVVGRVYNGSHQPPFLLPDHKTQSGIRSSSNPGKPHEYNELRFEDLKGKEEVLLRAQRNFQQLVLANRSAAVGGDDAVHVGGKRSLEVTEARSVTVGGDDAIHVGGNRLLEVAGDLNVNVGDAGGRCLLAASKTLFITAAESIEIRCGDSVLMLTPEAIRLTTAEASGLLVGPDQVEAKTPAGSRLVLNSQASLEGSRVDLKGGEAVEVHGDQIRLNCP